MYIYCAVSANTKEYREEKYIQVHWTGTTKVYAKEGTPL